MKAENPPEFTKFEELFWSVICEMGETRKQIGKERWTESHSNLVFTRSRKDSMKPSKLATVLGLLAGTKTAAFDTIIRHGF